jgi:two-component system sensor kinase FixL
MQDSARRELTIATMQSDGHLQILVSDTGPGIDAQAEANLFKPFVTTKKDGMGIGLSISRTIAEAHGGNLQYSANGDGGSTFILKLPLLNGKEPAP